MFVYMVYETVVKGTLRAEVSVYDHLYRPLIDALSCMHAHDGVPYQLDGNDAPHLQVRLQYAQYICSKDTLPEC